MVLPKQVVREFKLRQAGRLSSAPNVYDFGHVALFVRGKR